MTPEEIRNRLGLIDPDVFRVSTRHKRRHLAEVRCGARGMGRTTEGILRALSYMSENPSKSVLLIGHRQDATESIAKTAKEYAVQHGLEPGRIQQAPSSRKANPARGYLREQVFVDHVVFEEAWLHPELMEWMGKAFK